MDITKLEGYREDMTADEKLELIDGYTAPEPDYTGYVKKELLDKAAREAAEAKRELKGKQTEDEQKEAERKAQDADRDARLEKAEKELAVVKNKAKYMAMGYDEKTATDAATALADGDTEKMFSIQQTHLETIKKAAKAEALAGNNEPPAGQGKPVDERAALVKNLDEATKAGRTDQVVAYTRLINEHDLKNKGG